MKYYLLVKEKNLLCNIKWQKEEATVSYIFLFSPEGDQSLTNPTTPFPGSVLVTNTYATFTFPFFPTASK